MDSLIAMKDINLWHNKGKPSEVQALKKVNLEIKKGEYVTFFGPSGCGKTTLLFIIAGIGLPQEGEVIVGDHDLTKLSNNNLAIHRQVGMGIVFQSFNLIPSLTVLNNVAFPMAFLGVSRRKRNKKARELLTRLGIEAMADRYPYELSGGQQQRVGIARALANDPPIIVADEPLGNLDSENAEKVLDFLKELHEKDGRTVIMVTHEAWSLRDSERIFFMKDGAIVKTESSHDETVVQAVAEHAYGKITTKLSAPERSARALVHLLMRGYSAEELKRLEQFITQRVTNQMSSKNFELMLDKPFQEGGVGLWKQRAAKFSHIIEGIMEERKAVHNLLEELRHHPDHSSSYEIEHICEWLLEDYKGSVSMYQRARLNEVIDERIRANIDQTEVQKIINAPRKQSGLGFSFRESHWLAEKLESIIGQEERSALMKQAVLEQHHA